MVLFAGTDRSHRLVLGEMRSLAVDDGDGGPGHVVLKSRSRSPKGRPALARRREAHDEDLGSC